MRVLQVGAGSMGTRRLRDLHQRPGLTLTVLDERPDRRARAAQRFGVATVATLDEAWDTAPDAVIISTPPNEHDRYIAAALKRDLHFFCEADIWSYDHRRVEEATARSGRVAAPSCTLYFHPFVRELRRVVAEELGTLHAFGYLLSVDAPSWHPGEGAEYYARHRAMAPAREMVPFELIALGHVFGHATAASGRVTRRGRLDLEGEDTWSLQLALEGGATGQLTVVMAVPAPVRQGWAVGDGGAIRFDLLSGVLERSLPGGAAPAVETVCDWAAVYESMYDAEMTAFLAAVRGEAPWPYPYRTAARVCATLAAAELSMRSGRTEPVEPHRQPATLPDDYPRG